jgi:hypothetical protein
MLLLQDELQTLKAQKQLAEEEKASIQDAASRRVSIQQGTCMLVFMRP